MLLLPKISCQPDDRESFDLKRLFLLGKCVAATVRPVKAVANENSARAFNKYNRARESHQV